MKKILIASSNKHKIQEFNKMLNPLGIDVVSPSDFNDFDDVEEKGKTFKENALIKAKYYFDKYHLPTIADDSGISIAYFGGLPNIYSARFLKNLNYKDKNNLICKIMKGVNNRHAHYTCHLVYLDQSECVHFEAYLYGLIAEKPMGEHGFGYDPIFLVGEEGKTLGELSADVKAKISHRAKALMKLVAYFEKN